MAKKISSVAEHREIAEITHRHHMQAVNDSELNMHLLISIEAWLRHIDLCLSVINDREQKGGNKNDKKADRANDARDV